MGTPLVKAEQDRSIRVEDLPEVVVGGSRLRQAKQRLVPLEALGHVGTPMIVHVRFIGPSAA